MPNHTKTYSNFSQAITAQSKGYRPELEGCLVKILINNTSVIARGRGLSYSDACLNGGGSMIETARLNHLLSFDEETGALVCQGGATFADLFLVHPDYIPPVIPGTLHATIAGSIANDVHGKNNPHVGTFGHQVLWFDLQTKKQVYHCSVEENANLFHATIGGLGLTGIITRAAIKLRKESRFVLVSKEQHTSWKSLLTHMQNDTHKYQVAWLDLLSPERALLSYANPCDAQTQKMGAENFSIPPLPFRLITKWGMKAFNQCYFYHLADKPQIQPLTQFNNPLDSIKNWNRLYGKKGMLQFQAVIEKEVAHTFLTKLQTIITMHQALPTLAVLKYFDKPGLGLLSFAKPGFTIAIDFINNQPSINAIQNLNQLATEMGGRIYLAKDLLLTKEQFRKQYEAHSNFMNVLAQFSNPCQSNLSRRLGLTS
jgi:decaprenylphospho-beta-D-ribofuranose 2-oxidase